MSEEFTKMLCDGFKYIRTEWDSVLWREMLRAGERKCRYIKNGGLIGQIVRAFMAALAIDVIWMWLEVYVYGEARPNEVNTIIMAIMIPFIFKAVR